MALILKSWEIYGIFVAQYNGQVKLLKEIKSPWMCVYLLHA